MWTASTCRCATSWSLAHWDHMIVPIGVIRAPGICNLDFWNLADDRTPHPRGRFTPNQVLWNCLGMYMCNVMMVICPCGHNGHGCHKDSWNIADAGTQHLLGWFTPNILHWNCLGLYICNVMVICPWRHNGHAHGRCMGSWNLADARMPQPLGPIHSKVNWNHLGL